MSLGEFRTRQVDSMYQRLPTLPILQMVTLGGYAAEALVLLQSGDSAQLARRSLEMTTMTARRGLQAGLGLTRTSLQKLGISAPDMPQPDPETPRGQLELIERGVSHMHDELANSKTGPALAADYFNNYWHPAASLVDLTEAMARFELYRQQGITKKLTPKTDFEFSFDFGAVQHERGVDPRSVGRNTDAVLESVAQQPRPRSELIAAALKLKPPLL